MAEIIENRRQFFADQLENILIDEEAMAFLRDYQTFTVGKTSHHIGNEGETSGSIEAPAGSGKTEIIFAILNAAYHLREKATYKPRIFVVEPTRRLIKQTEKRLRDKFPDLPVGVYYSERQDLNQPITLITYDSFYSLVEAGIISPDDTDMLLLDEAHRGLSDLRRNVIDKFKPKSVIIGLTASSAFDEIRAIYRILGKVIHKIPDHELIDAGWLCPRANIIAEIKLPDNSGDPAKEAQLRRSAYVDSCLALYLGYQDNYTNGEPILGQKGLIYAWDVDHARDIADRFNKDPRVRSALIKITGNPDIVPVTVVNGTMSERELDEHFAAYKEGRTSILVGARIFIEGIDVPDASWEIRRAGNSLVDAIQTGGRVARPDKNNVAKTGRIFNIYISSPGIKRPVFDTDVTGTPRLGEVNVTNRKYRYKLPEDVNTETLPTNIILHNSPEQVQEFLNKLKPPTKLGTRHIASHIMAEEIGAWPPEVEHIYKVLTVSH